MSEVGNIMQPSRAERKIRSIVDKLRSGGHTRGEFFSIGNVEKRLRSDALSRGIEIAPGQLYMNDKQVQHALRDVHVRDGIDIPIEEFVTFPNRLFGMELWYDKNKHNYIYLDRENKSKYIVDTNRSIKVNRRSTRHAVVITARKLRSASLFGTDSSYEKINS